MSFRNARIVGVSADPKKYHAQYVERGHPEFVMSASQLKLGASCWSRWLAGYQAEKADGMDWGSLQDCRHLTPEQFESLYAVAPETYPDKKTGEPKPWNWNATYCQEWRDDQKGKEVIKASVLAESDAAFSALLDDYQIAKCIEVSQKQVWIQAEYVDHATGVVVPLKAMLDLVPPKTHRQLGKSILDLKTVASAHPRAWVSAVDKYGYDLQGALYLDLRVAATGEDRCDFRHILQESFPPYQTAKRYLTGEFIELGRMKYRSALARYAHCLATGQWPDYDASGRVVIDGFREAGPTPNMLLHQLDEIETIQEPAQQPAEENCDLIP